MLFISMPKNNKKSIKNHYVLPITAFYSFEREISVGDSLLFFELDFMRNTFRDKKNTYQKDFFFFKKKDDIEEFQLFFFLEI